MFQSPVSLALDIIIHYYDCLSFYKRGITRAGSVALSKHLIIGSKKKVHSDDQRESRSYFCYVHFQLKKTN